MLGDHLPADEGWSGRFDARCWAWDPNPVLDVAGMDWEAYRASRSANLCQQIRRRERRLAAAHDVRFRLANDPARLEPDFESFLALHDARWRGGSLTFAGEQARFHRRFVALALERGWLRLWLLELDGVDVAAWYGYRYGQTEWYRQAGRDPSHDALAVGFVLFVHAIRAAIEEGVLAYRLLPGDEQFKRCFATSDSGAETIALTRGMRGRAALHGARVVRAALSPQRRRKVVRLVTGTERY